METLGKLFGSTLRVKMMRLFLFHPEETFDIEQVKKRTRGTIAAVRKELNLLQKTGLLERASLDLGEEEMTAKTTRNIASKRKTAKRIKEGLRLSPDFPYTEAFQSILIGSETLKGEAVAKELEKTGRIKLIIAAGIFIGNGESRLDLFIVGDKIKKRNLENYIKALESDIGYELTYAVMDVNEYIYRQQVRDRLIRDVLDYPHERLIDRF